MNNKGAKLWKKAKKIIPGGTQLLSKRSEMFLPEQWPSYFKKAKGVEIWDLDGKKYIDMSYMGIGANILGYSDAHVNKAVKKVIDSGSMATLNSPEEVELAEIMIELHPWAGGVRFARTGGEAMAIAVRIGRAYSKKDKVAFCGYHGWHDWYLAANLSNKQNLDGQLLPGLKPLGVPRALKGTAIPFSYNKLEELKRIVSKNKIGVIVMESVREHEPEKNFLKKVRAVANRAGAVLIFDEITSGFRISYGGAYKLYGGEPDIVVYGKAIANGYPMSVVVGKKNIMDAAQKSFISSTFWTERIGPAAAVATLHQLKNKKTHAHLIQIGNQITGGWESLAKKHGIKIKTGGIPPLAHFSFEYKNGQALHTLFNQEMLKRGFLASKSVYASASHNKQHVVKYLACVDEIFSLIKKVLNGGGLSKYLKGPVAHAGFKRLT